MNNKDHNRVSKAVAQKIRATAKNMGYKPNSVARTLRTSKSNTLGFVTDEIATTPYASKVLEGAQDAASKLGYILLTTNTNNDAELENQEISALLRYNVDGFLYAAQIDGLSYFGYFFKIVLPLSSAILAVIGLYYFVGHWNDFMTGLIYITDDKKQPLQVVLQQLLLVAQGTGTNVNAAAQQQAADQIKFGIIIVSTLPLLVLYPFLQKYFNKGVMLGAVKG